MKKMMGKKAALLLAACLFATGLFVSCGDDDDDNGDGGVIAADSLEAPVGESPVAENATYSAKNGSPTFTFDTANRIMTMYQTANKTIDHDAKQYKYTYNTKDKTITRALLKTAIPSDVTAYFSHKDYEGTWTLTDKNGYINFEKTYFNAYVAALKEELNQLKTEAANLTGDEKTEVEAEIKMTEAELATADEEWNSVLAHINAKFSAAITYTYETSDNGLTLTQQFGDSIKEYGYSFSYTNTEEQYTIELETEDELVYHAYNATSYSAEITSTTDTTITGIYHNHETDGSNATLTATYRTSGTGNDTTVALTFTAPEALKGKTATLSFNADPLTLTKVTE